jgi:hypothetical protein
MNFEKLPQTIRELIDSIDIALEKSAGEIKNWDERERLSRLRWGLHSALDKYEKTKRKGIPDRGKAD